MAFNVLVVGAGMMGSNHIRTLSAMGNVNVHVTDTFKESLVNAKSKFQGISTYASMDEALKEKVDACIIATPTSNHKDSALRVIESGLPLLVEKPISTNVKDAKDIVNAAKANGVVLQVGHIERFNPVVTKLKQNIGNLGEIVYASAHRFGVPFFRKLDNVILDLAVHDIDVLSFLTNQRPKYVMGNEKNIISEEKDLSTLIFEYDTFLATVESNTVIPIKVRELSIMGKAGIARLNYIDQDLSIFKSESGKVTYGTFDELVTIVGKGTEVRTFIHKEEPLKLELENFLRSVNGESEPLATGEDGVYVVAAAEAAITATMTGKKEKIHI